MKFSCLFVSLMMMVSGPMSYAARPTASDPEPEVNMMDELDPYAPNINEILEQMDAFEREHGEAVRFDLDVMTALKADCYRQACAVYAQVSKSSQSLSLYVNGVLQGVWPASTGVPGRGTPDFDRHPDGRIYTRYTSTRYPGGDYLNLGNMPYAVFIQGGFAIHGTGRGNWRYLGQRASHGCIRVHPDNARLFNALVRQYGVRNTWITVY